MWNRSSSATYERLVFSWIDRTIRTNVLTFLPAWGKAFPPKGAEVGRYGIAKYQQLYFYYIPNTPFLLVCDQIPSIGLGENFDFYCNLDQDALYMQELAIVDLGARENIFYITHLIELTGSLSSCSSAQHP